MTFTKQTRNIASALTFAATALIAALPATAQAAAISGGTFTDASVKNYTYAPTVTVAGWDFSGKTGITVANNSFGMIAPNGSQAALLQGADAEISTIRFITDTAYTLTFDAEGRSGYGANPLAVYLQSTDVVGAAKIYLTQNLIATVGTFTTYSFSVSNLTAGYYKLVFDGLGALNANNVARDVTTFIDNVSDSTPVPEPTSTALLGLGMLGLFAASRKRTKA